MIYAHGLESTTNTSNLKTVNGLTISAGIFITHKYNINVQQVPLIKQLR